MCSAVGSIAMLNSAISFKFYSIVILISLFFVYNLYKLRNWARLFFIFGCVFDIIQFIINILTGFDDLIIIFKLLYGNSYYEVGLFIYFINVIVGIISLYYLTRKDVVACFKRK